MSNISSFSTVPGYFLQDDSETDPKIFDFVRFLILRRHEPFLIQFLGRRQLRTD